MDGMGGWAKNWEGTRMGLDRLTHRGWEDGGPRTGVRLPLDSAGGSPTKVRDDHRGGLSLFIFSQLVELIHFAASFNSSKHP